MQKVIPHLWYDKEAKDAAAFYVDAFGKDSRVTNVNTIHNTPSGSVDVVSFRLWGQDFEAISAGPLFKFNPSISFLVKCITTEEVDSMWQKLSDGGMVMMELGEYPFNKRYGWTQDKYGVSWQIIYLGEAALKQPITPALMFVGDVYGRAKEAIEYYTNVFHDSKAGNVMTFTKGEDPDKEGNVKFGEFEIEGKEFAIMESAHAHKFAFNEAISFIVNCNDQEEIDYYWNKLSADPKSEQCGWLKDKFGISWQIVPVRMNEMLQNGSPEQISRVTEAFLKMKKFDLAELEEAYQGK